MKFKRNFFFVISGERSRLLPAESNSIIEEGSQESLQTQEPNYYNQRSQVARVWKNFFKTFYNNMIKFNTIKFKDVANVIKL